MLCAGSRPPSSSAAPGNRLGDISHAVQTVVEERGYGVVRSLVGHGVGRTMHEEPQIPNYGPAGRGPKLAEGMVFAIEPMITVGDYNVEGGDDGWAIYTRDGSLAAHCEHTVAITKEGPGCSHDGYRCRKPARDDRVLRCSRGLLRRAPWAIILSIGGPSLKVRPSVRRMCEKCRIIRRHGNVLVICTNPRHKQRQG